MKYVCMSCWKEVELDLKTARKVQCSSCGYRIIMKERPAVVRKIAAV